MNLFDGIGKPIVVASHPRSGTHLAIDLLRKQFPANFLPVQVISGQRSRSIGFILHSKL